MEKTDHLKLKRKIILLLSGGIIMLATQFYYYHFILMLGGFGLILYAFFSIKSAEGEQYRKEHIKPLMYYPMAIAAVAGIVAFFVKQQLLFCIFSMVGAIGLYTIIKGKVLLNFVGYKVYRGFYAYTTGLIFFAMGAGLAALMLFYVPADQKNSISINHWVTTGDKSSLLEARQNLTFSDEEGSSPAIHIDSAQQFQSIDGFGYALTGGSAMLLHTKLNATQRSEILKELFLTEGNGIGVSYLRVSIGASDLDEFVFSYDDLPKGKTDPTLSKFNLSYDTLHLIPVLKEILTLNPKIKIMGSPWSPPVWMKTNQLPKGGSLKPEYYETYATYFVKYIRVMAKNGITINAITLQNEPENPKNTPSLVMTAAEQALFVKKYLGPAFKKNNIKTKIIVYDHNCDHPEYPIAILDDAEAKPFVDGSAFHLYLGEIEALTTVHDAHPDKNIYFTEQWTSGKGDFAGDLKWHTKNLIIGATRNWSRSVLEWNLAADPNFDPHTGDGGCDICQGALTIGDGSVTRNVSYYIIAHASKFVPPGSVRIGSNLVEGLPNVAFLTPEGKKVLIVLNETDEPKSFSIQFNSKTANASLTGGAVGTFVW
jgi:glucosylceramidase